MTYRWRDTVLCHVGTITVAGVRGEAEVTAYIVSVDSVDRVLYGYRMGTKRQRAGELSKHVDTLRTRCG